MRSFLLSGLETGRMIFVLILMAQFQFWDSLMTHVFVRSGLINEGNPLVVTAVRSGDFVYIKLLGLMLLIPVLWIVFRRFPRMAFSMASCMAIFYGAVITWNFLVLFHVAM